MLRGSTRTVSFVSEPEEDETIVHDKASEDSVKEAIVRWIIYIITYALIIIGTGAIWVGLVLNDSLTHISADKIGYGSHVITHIFILCGVATIVVGYAGGCWFNAHQGLMLKVHFCLIITTILLYILVIVIVVFASTARRADDYLNECWEEYANKNRTVDMMELQIRFFCCGINGIKDYTEGDYVLRMSCYFKFNMRGQPFQQTCSHAIKDYFHQKRNDCIIFNSVVIVLLIIYLILCKLLHKWRVIYV
ncbi:uncharacterized protein LOC132785001 isoform X1 [Drosophila nasuta]|uniref:uncharacterized protein LOC132785001 isoform X1 n=1 Tax=Drosophila nasuta TaxID=42062 RepID=UPI00295F3B51|nr:uncharacterized protein LOC132785001 isoform X1 [Drosophila nasuta]